MLLKKDYLIVGQDVKFFFGGTSCKVNLHLVDLHIHAPVEILQSLRDTSVDFVVISFDSQLAIYISSQIAHLTINIAKYLFIVWILQGMNVKRNSV